MHCKKDKMRNKVIDLINRYWKFDSDQQPTSSWHDKQDLLDAIRDLFDDDTCFQNPKFSTYSDVSIYDNEDINGVNELNKKSYDDYKERKLIQSKKWMR